MRSQISTLTVAFVLQGLVCSVSSAARAPELPDDQDSWVNSPPISLSTLEGKAAILWFFEET